MNRWTQDGACLLLGARAQKVYRALKLHPEDRVATRLVARIDALFAIDAEARSANLDHAARHALRPQRARPLLDILKPQMEAAQAEAVPARALGKAPQYTLTLWPKLTRFLEYPELELSNNLAENSTRPLVLARKNWIHLGSRQAGPKVAAILSIVESCRRLKFPIRDYLASILPGLAAFPIHRITELTPAVWATR